MTIAKIAIVHNNVAPWIVASDRIVCTKDLDNFVTASKCSQSFDLGIVASRASVVEDEKPFADDFLFGPSLISNHVY